MGFLSSIVSIGVVITLAMMPLAADSLPEEQAVALVKTHAPLMLRQDTQTSRNAGAKVTFWVGKEGTVEAVELACGERAVFDETVDRLLEWKFSGKNFKTDFSLVRRGQRVWLLYEIPSGRRPRRDVCAGRAAAATGPAPSSD